MCPQVCRRPITPHAAIVTSASIRLDPYNRFNILANFSVSRCDRAIVAQTRPMLAPQKERRCYAPDILILILLSLNASKAIS